MNEIKILLVDDHEIVRDGLKSVISSETGLKVIGEASNGDEAIEKCSELEPDLIIMDINMPEKNGIQAATEIKKLNPNIRILALTMSDNELHIKRMIQAGASGYILKDSGVSEFRKAIRELMADRHYFSNEAAQSVLLELIQHRGKSKPSENYSITKRELDVLKLIVNEHTNQEIAEKLFISVRTVDAHRRNLLEKTGAKNTAGLVRYALENGLV